MFTRTEFCTEHCGLSSFPDWEHTPLCESRAEAAYERDIAEAEAAQERADYEWVAAMRRERTEGPASLYPEAPPRRPRWLDRAAKDLTGDIR